MKLYRNLSATGLQRTYGTHFDSVWARTSEERTKTMLRKYLWYKATALFDFLVCRNASTQCRECNELRMMPFARYNRLRVRNRSICWHGAGFIMCGWNWWSPIAVRLTYAYRCSCRALSITGSRAGWIWKGIGVTKIDQMLRLESSSPLSVHICMTHLNQYQYVQAYNLVSLDNVTLVEVTHFLCRSAI